MTTSSFTAVIKIRDGNPYILVTAARATAINPGWRKPLPVLVRINGQPANAWRINMMPVGNGSFYLPEVPESAASLTEILDSSQSAGRNQTIAGHCRHAVSVMMGLYVLESC